MLLEEKSTGLYHNEIPEYERMYNRFKQPMRVRKTLKVGWYAIASSVNLYVSLRWLSGQAPGCGFPPILHSPAYVGSIPTRRPNKMRAVYMSLPL